jgi:hypothetical protein
VIFWFMLSLLALAVLAIVPRARMYGRLFGDQHFIEIARRLASIKTAALANVTSGDEAPRSPADDPRVLVTVERLVVVYTVKQRDAAFVHHCSVSVAGSATAHAVGSTFLVFVVKVLGLPIDKMIFEFGDTTVHHAETVLDGAAHAALAAAPTVAVTATNVGEIRREVMEARDRVRWGGTTPSAA